MIYLLLFVELCLNSVFFGFLLDKVKELDLELQKMRTELEDLKNDKE